MISKSTWLSDENGVNANMMVEELYAQIGGDYAEAIGRLRSDALVKRFIVKFLDDPACPGLLSAWESGDEAAAFESAHAAKGVCGNLALVDLAALASGITEALRPGNDIQRAETDVDALVARFGEAYRAAIAKIAEIA